VTAVPGEPLPEWWAPRPRGARAAGWGAAIALGLHALIAIGVVKIDPRRFHAEPPIEIDVEEKLPPPEVKPPPPDKPPPEPPRPRVVHRAPSIAPPPTPPPPSEAPPRADEPPPTFGVSLSATTGGDSSVAVPVGNTLMTKPATKVEKPKPLAGDGGGGFVPVAEIYIAKHAEKIWAPDGEDNYPPEAKRLGLEGAVKIKLGIDEHGRVVQAKVVEGAGHGFDEAALKAMRQAKFKPAETSDGRTVPCSIIWTYRFETDH